MTEAALGRWTSNGQGLQCTSRVGRARVPFLGRTCQEIAHGALRTALILTLRPHARRPWAEAGLAGTRGRLTTRHGPACRHEPQCNNLTIQFPIRFSI
jgi:hypothetical protein